MYPINKIRSNFPILNSKITYLDNASSTYKPISVINAIYNFYKYQYSSPRKSICYYGINITNKIEKIRSNLAKFINSENDEIIFVKSATEAINLISNSYSLYLKLDDNIIISIMEHHSNILPWYKLYQLKKIKLKIISLTKKKHLNINNLIKLIDNNTKIVSISQSSNVLGIINPIEKIIKLIRSINKKIIIVIDGSQSILHFKVNVKKLDCDFYLFSGHKIYGPCGIGILYGKRELLKIMNPWELGGSMVNYINLKNKEIKYMEHPWKFEAGTINSPAIIGLDKAIKFIEYIGIENISKWENDLINYTIENMTKNISNLIIYGSYNNKVPIISFNIKNINSFDIGYLLCKENIIIRTGNQCAIPLMDILNIDSVCRISFSLYTNFNDIDLFIKKLKNIVDFLIKH